MIKSLFAVFFWSFGAWANGLIIGDSHTVGGFGSALKATLEQQTGIMFDRYGVVSASAKDWSKPAFCVADRKCSFQYGYTTPEETVTDMKPVPPELTGFYEIRRKAKPEYIVFALGTNDATKDGGCTLPIEKTKKMTGAELAEKYKVFGAVKKMLDAASSSRGCVWIGPPTYENPEGPVIKTCGKEGYANYIENLKKTVQSSSCTFVESRTITKPVDTCYDQYTDSAGKVRNKCDKLHFNSGPKSRSYGTDWGTKAAEETAGFLGFKATKTKKPTTGKS